MSVLLTEEWGGCRVSDLTAEVLSKARAAAVLAGAAYVTAPHLESALLQPASGQVSHAAAVLRAVGRLANEPAADVTASMITNTTIMSPTTILGPEEQLRAVLRSLPEWMAVTGDERATTLHLLAALMDAAMPGLQVLNHSGLTGDLVLMVGMRCRGSVEPGDAAFLDARTSALNGANQNELSVPAPPTADELARRTPARQWALGKQVMDAYLPADGGRASTPLGIVRLDRWGKVLIARYTMQLCLLALLAWWAFTRGPWWFSLIALSVPFTPPLLSVRVWLTIRAAALILAPWPARMLLATEIVQSLLVIRYELWMKRVDLADPAYGLRAMRSAVFAAGAAARRAKLVAERTGVEDD